MGLTLKVRTSPILLPKSSVGGSLVTTYLTQLMMQPCKTQPCKTLFINTPKIEKIGENVQWKKKKKKRKFFTGHQVSSKEVSKSLHVKIEKIWENVQKKKKTKEKFTGHQISSN